MDQREQRAAEVELHLSVNLLEVLDHFLYYWLGCFLAEIGGCAWFSASTLIPLVMEIQQQQHPSNQHLPQTKQFCQRKFSYLFANQLPATK